MTYLKPRSATVVIYQGDDMERLGDLRRTVDLAEKRLDAAVKEAAAQAATARAGDDDASFPDLERRVEETKAEFDAFVTEAAERALEVELNSIGKKRFHDLVLAHPPRMVDSEPDEDGKTKQVEHEDDQGYGVNTETFSRALLTYRENDKITVVRPEFSSVAGVSEFVDDELSEGDFDRAWVAAFFLNRQPSADPKALVYGSTSPSGSET